MTSYTLLPAGFRQAILLAPWMGETIHGYAERIKAAAEATAPVDTDPDDRDTHPGRYRDSFGIEDTVYKGERVESIVYNDAPEALYVEYGNVNTPEHATLRKALIL